MTADHSESRDAESYERAIDTHYGKPDLAESIFGAYENAGKDVDNLTREDITSFDEFHIRGLEATRELADLASLTEGSTVLDVGCGVGGPARTLAAEYGCDVTGIDLAAEYVDLSTTLTKRVGLADSVRFRQANALDLPFDAESFDAVWLQHVSMNVADKTGLLGELRRVLKPDGTLAIYEICAGPTGSPYFPVPWADDDSISFLASPERFVEIAVHSDFEERAWRDVTAESLEWFRGVLDAMESRPADANPPLGLNLLMGERTPEKVRNVVRNLSEERIAVVQGVFERA